MADRTPLFQTLTLIVLTFLLTGCGGGGGGGNSDNDDGDRSPSGNTAQELARALSIVDTSNAEGYMITGNDADTTSSASVDAQTVVRIANTITLEANSLYKVTADGTLERATIQDDGGDELPRGSIRPIELKDINEDYMMMWFWIPGLSGDEAGSESLLYDEDVVAYLVRKEDGAAFNASEILLNAALGLGQTDDNEVVMETNRVRFETDSRGNLFYAVYIDEFANTAISVLRVDLSGVDSGEVTARDLQDLDNIGTFASDGDGDFVAYSGSNRLNPEQDVFRMIDMESGSISNLLGTFSQSEPNGFYRDFKGNVYALGEGTVSNSVYRIEQDGNGEPQVTYLADLNVTSTTGAVPSPTTNIFTERQQGTDRADGVERLVLDGREFLVWNDGVGRKDQVIYEVAMDAEDGSGNPEPRVIGHDGVFGELSDIRESRVSGNYIWQFGTGANTGTDTIARYNPLTETVVLFEALTDPNTGGELDISDFRVLSSDRVFFQAQRLNDSATVIGEISVDGDITITDVVEADEPSVFVLKPINPTDFIVVDGFVKDWATDLRVVEDASGDATTGNDLRYYSQRTGNGNYFGLIEFEDDIASDILTRVRINDAWELRITESSAVLAAFDASTGLMTGTASSLESLGGAAAVNEAVEFRVPESELDSPSSYAVSAERVGDRYITSLSSALDNDVHTIEVGMGTPIGDATLEVDLGNGYALVMDDQTAETDNGSGADPAQSYDPTEELLTIEIDDGDIGSPGSELDLSKTSSATIIDSLSTD